MFGVSVLNHLTSGVLVAWIIFMNISPKSPLVLLVSPFKHKLHTLQWAKRATVQRAALQRCSGGRQISPE